MKVYVDELPKSCAKCELCSHIFTNCLPNLYKCAVDGHARFDEYKVEDEEPCPLQSLAEYTKQVRKEVCEEIKDIAGNYFELPYCDNCGETNNDDVILTGNDLTEILEQIQGEKVE